MDPTLQQVFGASATQTATTVTINKADLPTLTPSANNTAESLLIAILLEGKAALPKTTFDTNTDQSIYIDSGYPSFTTRGTNNDSYRVDQFVVNLAKADTAGIIDADDY